MLISTACLQASADHGDDPAFLLEDGTALTFDEVRHGVDRIARTLVDAGVVPTDRIAFAAPRGPLGLVGFLGISAVAVCCPVNPRLKDSEYERAFGAIAPAALVVADESVARQSAELAGVPIGVLTGDRAIELSIRKMPRPVDRTSVAEGDRCALLMQTSGTTAKPKTVLLTHENILSAARGIVAALRLGRDDVCLNPMPLHHVHGLISAGVSSLLAGSAALCTRSFSPEEFDALYERFRPTWFTGSPAMHIALREHYRNQRRTPRNNRLRFLRSSSAPLPAAVIAELEEIFGAPLIETYGLTESASMVATNPLPPGIRKLGSVGIACSAELKVVDDTGSEVAADVVGEIVMRGPSVIRGYAEPHNNTGDTFFGSWLRTGDLGRVDADGYYFITGRRKELIKRGGLSVYPGEIDNVLIADARVAEAATFAIEHPTLGEEVVAVVVATQGVTVSGDALRQTLIEQLSAYKVPAEIFVVPAIGKTETGKINRKDLAASFRHLLTPRNEPAATRVEGDLLAEWRRVLGRVDIGATDNLFLFGADPLRAAQVGDRLVASSPARLSSSDMFREPTVRRQAALLAARAQARR